MEEKNFELIEHTADIGIRVKGKNLKEVFSNTAIALFQIIAEAKPAKTSHLKKLKIKVSAQDLEELLVNWLNELLSLSSAKGIIFNDFKINKLAEFSLEAVALGCASKNYRFNCEVKAATYHQLKINKTKSGWLAEVIFDV